MKNQIVVLFSLMCGLMGCSVQPKKTSQGFLHNLDLSRYTEEGYPAAWYIEAQPNMLTIEQPTQPYQAGIKIIKNSIGTAFFYTPMQIKTECIKSLSATTQMNGSSDIKASVVFMVMDDKSPDVARPTAGIDKNMVISHSKKSKNGCLGSDFLMGLLVTGEGEISISGFELTINGQIFQDSVSPSVNIDNTDIRILRDKVITLDDLPDSKAWFNDAHIIGLGENSHGAKNLFEMKTELIQYAIEKTGVTQVSLEMPAINALVVNDYIQGKSDDKQKTLLSLNYPSWQTQSMMRLLEWLREYNLKNSNSIVFSGFDVQQPLLTLSVLKNKLQKDQDVRGVEYLEILSALISNNDPDVQAFNKSIQQLKQHLTKHKPELTRFADVLRKGAILQNPTLGTGDRSEFMAQQVIKLAQKRKTVIWADNTHVTKKPSAMGAWIDAAVGNKYLAIGFTYDRGNYSAYGPQNPYPVHRSFRGTHEDILKRLENQTFLIKLSDLPQDHPLLERREFRFIGSQPQTYSQFYPHRLNEHFDIIGFTHRTSHTEFMVEHDF